MSEEPGPPLLCRENERLGRDHMATALARAKPPFRDLEGGRP